MPRLLEIEQALWRGDSIDDGLREELIALTAFVANQNEALLKKTRRGAPVDFKLFKRASVVLALRLHHKIKLAAALSAVARQTGTDEQKRKDCQNIGAAYKARRKSGDTIMVSGSAVRDALIRLSPQAKGK